MAHQAMERHNSITKRTRENIQNCRCIITFETGTRFNSVNSWALPCLLIILSAVKVQKSSGPHHSKMEEDGYNQDSSLKWPSDQTEEAGGKGSW